MPRSLLLALVIAPALAAAGCIDLEEDFTLNPDGSGKVVVHWIHSPLDLSGKSEPEAQMLSAVRDEIEKSEGVEAWKDVTWSLRDDGRVEFKGTAYFKDFSKLRLHTQGVKLLKLTQSREASGAIAMELGFDKSSSGEKKPEKALTDDEVKAKVKIERAKYQQSKPMVESMLKDMRCKVTLRLPGALASSNNFKKQADGAVQVGIEGKTLFKILDDMINDDAWMTRQIKENGGMGQDGPPPEILQEKLFGEKGPVRAVTAAAVKALFDYEAEAAPARLAMPELLKKVGGRAPAPPATKGGAFKSLKVGGVQIVHFSDNQRGISPLNGFQEGMTLSFVGEFPGTVLNMKEGRLEKAVSDAGDDLLPADEWQRKINFPRLSNDKTTVTFDVHLRLPGDKVKGLKEVSGVLEYTVGDKTKEVDLGISEYKAETKGKEFGARIAKLEESSWQKGHDELDLELAVEPGVIESVAFEDEKGGRLDAQAGGSMSGGRSTTLSFLLKGKFPAKGRIVVKAYLDLKTFEIPFAVKEIDLLGRPLK